MGAGRRVLISQGMLWAMGVGFTLFRGAVSRILGETGGGLDLMTILLAYMYGMHGETAAGLFAVGQSLIMGLLSVNSPGYYAAGYLGALGAIHLGTLFINLASSRGQVLLTALAVWTKAAVLALCVGILGDGVPLVSSKWGEQAIAGAVTGLVAPAIFWGLKRVLGPPPFPEEES